MESAPDGRFKKLEYLSRLTQFECSIIAKFLTSREKLRSLQLTNRAWHSLIHSHYAWTVLPDFGPRNWEKSLRVVEFCEKFASLSGIAVPWAGGKMVSSPQWLAKLKTASVLHFVIDRPFYDLTLEQKQKQEEEPLFLSHQELFIKTNSLNARNLDFRVLNKFIHLESLQLHLDELFKPISLELNLSHIISIEITLSRSLTLLDLQLCPLLESLSVENLDEYIALKLDLILPPSNSLRSLSLHQTLLTSPSVTAMSALHLKDFTLLDSVQNVPPPQHFQFPELETLHIKRFEIWDFQFRDTLIILKFETHRKNLFLCDFPLLREVHISTAFFVHFSLLPSLEIITSDSCSFTFKEGGIGEEPFILEKADRGEVFQLYRIKKFYERIKRISMLKCDQSPILLSEEFPSNEAIRLEFPNYMHLMEELTSIFPCLQRLELFIPNYAVYQDCCLSLPSLRSFSIESKGEGSHALIFEAACVCLEEVQVLDSWQKGFSLHSQVALKKVQLSCDNVLSISCSQPIELLSLGQGCRVNNFKEDFGVREQVKQLQFNFLIVESKNYSPLVFPRLTHLTLIGEMAPIYLDILEGSPRLQLLKLVGISSKDPIRVPSVESVEYEDSSVSLSIGSEHSVIGVKGNELLQFQ